LKINEQEFNILNKTFDAEYQEIIRKNFSTIGLFMDSYPVPI